MAQKLLNYEVLERLGEGARSTIYAVMDPLTKNTFALKHVLREDTKDIRFIEQMENEFAISKQFTHPNLRRSYDLKIVKSMLLKVNEAYLIMELFHGKALDVYLPPSVVDIVDAFIQAAQGLKALHVMGYVHCDIKPNNIMRTDAGQVKVIDFGQSAKIGTVKERIQGTPDFIAPEQVTRRPISVQTDVFNLGATLYWSLTGKHIPTAYTVNKKGENSFLLDTRIDTPQDLNPKVPSPLSNLVMECIATKAQKRPAEMDQVITRLELAKHVLTRPAVTPSTSSVNDALSDSNF
jgi:eukaryotic-like serine/threonine-protein kinase